MERKHFVLNTEKKKWMASKICKWVLGALEPWSAAILQMHLEDCWTPEYLNMLGQLACYQVFSTDMLKLKTESLGYELQARAQDDLKSVSCVSRSRTGSKTS